MFNVLYFPGKRLVRPGVFRIALLVCLFLLHFRSAFTIAQLIVLHASLECLVWCVLSTVDVPSGIFRAQKSAYFESWSFISVRVTIQGGLALYIWCAFTFLSSFDAQDRPRFIHRTGITL